MQLRKPRMADIMHGLHDRVQAAEFARIKAAAIALDLTGKDKMKFYSEQVLAMPKGAALQRMAFEHCSTPEGYGDVLHACQHPDCEPLDWSDVAAACVREPAWAAAVVEWLCDLREELEKDEDEDEGGAVKNDESQSR